MSSRKKEFILDGLDCANCAAKIEKKVNEIDGIMSVSMNYTTKTLTFETDKTEDTEALTSHIKGIVKKIEPNAVVREKTIQKTDKKVMILMGLDCANCATKIETKVKNLSGVKSASVDFVSKKLSIDVQNVNELNNIIQQIRDVISKIEPDITVVFNDQKAEANATKEQDDNSHGQASEEEKNNKKELIRLAVGAVIFGIGVAFKFTIAIEFVLFFISYILVGIDVLVKAVKNIFRGQVFDENFLMSIATIGAFTIRQFPEGVAVMLFYQVGEYIQDIAVNRSRKSITELMDIRPDYANLVVGNETKRVSPEEVNVKDLILVKPGERVPLDGKIMDGKSMVDTSALTGESVPREVEKGSEVLSGFINKNGLLTVEVMKDFGESTVTKILDLVQNASGRKLSPNSQGIILLW